MHAGPAIAKRSLLVVGNGMVGHRFVEELDRLGGLADWSVTVLGEEPRPAYDRVALSSFFDGASADDLAIGTSDWYADRGVDLVLSSAVTQLDRPSSQVTVASGNTYAYDHLVLATGSYPFVPPIDGKDLPGCFVYRTIEDLEAIRTRSLDPSVRVGVVVGGGLLGLEAANALRLLGLETHVVEFAPRLMPLQVCEGGGAALLARVEEFGVHVHLGAAVASVRAAPSGDSVGSLVFADGTELVADLVVFSAGVRPRDELARSGGLVVGERGGVMVDESCRTNDPDVSAIGECALVAGRVWGLVAPGYEMARVVARRLVGEAAEFAASDLSTKLKLLGIDVASFGDVHGTDPASGEVRHVTWTDTTTNVYRRLVLSEDGSHIVGGVLVGDASGAAELMAMVRGQMPMPGTPRLLVLPAEAAGAAPLTSGSFSPDSPICSCNNVTAGAICAAISELDLTDVPSVKKATGAGTGCGGCVQLVKRVLDQELVKNGREVTNRLCEHFSQSRAELFDIVRVRGFTTFTDLIADAGSGRGCDICKPAVASMFASMGSGHILDGEQAGLQDTNDRFLANLQKDGTYSVVPRIPGGEVTAAQLIAIGRVAEDFGLYVKITGGQRIDLFGARVEQLPDIWRRLVAVGLESGHAYGKALRTVKSCVGQTWCRYGVQDSTTLAIEIEKRYRGLRAPHKIKMAVSGCTRECAEAQSKDVGIIATERGWNLWVGGNGGVRPRHAELLAEDLDAETLVRYIDRFLALYVRTADRLERTAPWIERRPGGIAALRRVICEDELGLAADLEAMIEHHVRTYECEWTATLASPSRLEHFVSFVNSDLADPSIMTVIERDQIRPANEVERLALGAVPVSITRRPIARQPELIGSLP